MTEVAEAPSPVAEAHARAGHRCELCNVRNFAIGGRDHDGNFHPVYACDPAEARSKLGKRAWCGTLGPEVLLRVIRVVCEFVTVTDEDSSTSMLLCQRCVKALRDRERVRVEVAA